MVSRMVYMLLYQLDSQMVGFSPSLPPIRKALGRLAYRSVPNRFNAKRTNVSGPYLVQILQKYPKT